MCPVEQCLHSPFLCFELFVVPGDSLADSPLHPIVFNTSTSQCHRSEQANDQVTNRRSKQAWKQILNPSIYAERVDPVQVQCCFTSTETTWTIRDGDPRTASSTFMQLLNSVTGRLSSMLLYVHRDHADY